MSVLAGFVNRAFALPAKLTKMEFISMSPAMADTLEKIGVYLFFAVIGVFAVWVMGTFVKNIRTLKGEEVYS